MTMTAKCYANLKQAGLPWLDQVPSHWRLVPNRFLLRQRKVLVGGRHRDFQLLSLTKQGVILRDVESGRGKFSADMGTSQEVRSGDLVFCLFDVPETPRTVGLSRHDGMITGAYSVFECPDRTLAAYLDAFYRALDDRKLLSPIYSGLRNTIPMDRFLSTKTPVPPPEEQAAIVRYLDHVDRRIRRYIAAKKKLIALLNEQKQAIIHRAVTRGLDPNMRLKPSRVEWLGEIPEHWGVLLNQRIFKEEIRPHRGEPEPPLSLSQKDGLIATSEMKERSLQTASYENWKVTVPGDLVLNRFKAHLGVFFASTLRGIVSFHYGVFAPRRPLITKYFELLFHTNIYRTIFAGRSNGMTVGLQNLSNQNFYNVRTILPPLEEQLAIVSAVQEAARRIDAAIRATIREIALLREHHTRLVADVVTGTLDVREPAAGLPNEEIAPLPPEIDDDLDDADTEEEDELALTEAEVE